MGESGSDSEMDVARVKKKRHREEKERVEESIGKDKEGEGEEVARDTEEGRISKETTSIYIEPSSDKTTAGQ